MTTYVNGTAHEWVETQEADERFLPLIEAEPSHICERLWLGSEENVRDVVWMKVTKITRVVTIMPYPVDPREDGTLSEALKGWHTDNVETLFLECLDTPSALVFEHVRKACAFILENMAAGRSVIVHCGRGISRSATLVIAALMVRDGLSYQDAFAATSAKRACIYPNIGFQLQLCLFEKLGRDFDKADAVVSAPDFDIAAELAVSVRKVLTNVEEQADAMFEDDALADDPQRWEDFGFFVQNCREYLGHVDVGLPFDLMSKAEDVARQLQNLSQVFEGAGVDTAGRVGRVLGVWHDLQSRLSAQPESLPRVPADYVSCLDKEHSGGGSGKRRRVQ